MNRWQKTRLACLAAIGSLVVHEGVVADEAMWKQEFERICIQVETASGLSAKQLQVLIQDSDKLLERLSDVSQPQAKIYIVRLKKCRDFFSFMLEAKLQDTPQ